MTESELKDKYYRAWRIIKAERTDREKRYRHMPALLAEKLAELDRLLAILTELKDELKPHVEVQEEQLRLIRDPAPEITYK